MDTYVYRSYCRSKRGKKVVERISGKKYERLSVVAGKQGEKIISPMIYKNTMTSELFEQWIQEMLLKEIKEESIIVMDNAAFHRKAALQKIIEKTNHTLIFLPPYSPNLNPIEKYWANMKREVKNIVHMFDDFYQALVSVFKV